MCPRKKCTVQKGCLDHNLMFFSLKTLIKICLPSSDKGNDHKENSDVSSETIRTNQTLNHISKIFLSYRRN